MIHGKVMDAHGERHLSADSASRAKTCKDTLAMRLHAFRVRIKGQYALILESI